MESVTEAHCMPSERQLDPGALGDHIDRLYRAAWGLCGSREEAEDLVQETLTLVLRKPRILRSENDLGYLVRVLRNTFVSSRRTAGASSPALPPSKEPPPSPSKAPTESGSRYKGPTASP